MLGQAIPALRPVLQWVFGQGNIHIAIVVVVLVALIVGLGKVMWITLPKSHTWGTIIRVVRWLPFTSLGIVLGTVMLNAVLILSVGAIHPDWGMHIAGIQRLVYPVYPFNPWQ